MKGPIREQAGCSYLLGLLPEEVWIRLVWLVSRCLNMHLPERLPEDPTHPGCHGERLFVEEEVSVRQCGRGNTYRAFVLQST